MQDDTKKNATNRSDEQDDNKKGSQGFASMTQEEVENIASKGGTAAQASGNAHQLTDKERKDGGETRADQLGHKGYQNLGEMGADKRWHGDNNSKDDSRDE